MAKTKTPKKNAAQQPSKDAAAATIEIPAFMAPALPGQPYTPAPVFGTSAHIGTTNDDIATLIIEEMEAQLDVTLEQRKDALAAAQKAYDEKYDPKKASIVRKVGESAVEAIKAAAAKIRAAVVDVDPVATVSFVGEEKFASPPKATQAGAFYENIASSLTTFGSWWASYGKEPLQGSLTFVTTKTSYGSEGVSLSTALPLDPAWAEMFMERKKDQQELAKLQEAVAAVHREKAKSAARQRTVRANIARTSLERTPEGRSVYEQLRQRSLETLVRAGFAPAIDAVAVEPVKS